MLKVIVIISIIIVVAILIVISSKQREQLIETFTVPDFILKSQSDFFKSSHNLEEQPLTGTINDFFKNDADDGDGE